VYVCLRMPGVCLRRSVRPQVTYEWHSSTAIVPVSTGEGVSGGARGSGGASLRADAMVCFDKERHEGLDGMPAEGQEVRIFFPALVWASDRFVVKKNCRARVLNI